MQRKQTLGTKVRLATYHYYYFTVKNISLLTGQAYDSIKTLNSIGGQSYERI